MAAILFTACTQDELAENSTALPEGEYPLQIGSVSITAESSEEPWTRVAENETDGMGSHWTGGERIGVRIAGSEETGIYRIKVDDAGNVTITPDKTVYWKSTQPAEVTAWYPAEASRVSLGSQHMDGLTYVLRGTGTGNHQSPVTLQFEHQLAKVRVVLNGTQAGQVESVEVYSITACNHLRGSLDYNASNTGWIKMKKQTFANGTECWEANVVPGEVISQIKVNNTEATLTKPLIPKVAALNTIDLTVGENQIFGGETITKQGEYIVKGTVTESITLDSEDITLILEGADVNTNGIAINIVSGNPTLKIQGTENAVKSTTSTAIHVGSGCTLTIEGVNGTRYYDHTGTL